MRQDGRDKIIEKKDRLARLIAAIKLLRATQTTPLNLVYINHLTTTHPDLLDLIQGEWNSDGYFNTTKLKNHIIVEGTADTQAWRTPGKNFCRNNKKHQKNPAKNWVCYEQFFCNLEAAHTKTILKI